jgi:hypothetical protein
MPTPELLARADLGDVRLGGCDPTFEHDRVGDCPVCGAWISQAAIDRYGVPYGVRAIDRAIDGRAGTADLNVIRSLAGR